MVVGTIEGGGGNIPYIVPSPGVVALEDRFPIENVRDVSSCESRGREFDGEANGRKYVGEIGDDPSSLSTGATNLSFPLSFPPPAKFVIIFEGRLNNVLRPLSLAGLAVLSASLDARFRLLSNRASVADNARSRETGGCVETGVVLVEVVVGGVGGG